MRRPITARTPILAAALAAVAATAWAASQTLKDSTWVPAPYAAPETAPATRAMPLEAAAIPQPARPTSILPSNAHVPAASEAPEAAIVERSAPQPPITIEERRLTPDERIQAQLLDVLANAADVSGKIGVESHDAVVTLSGYTTTVGQARRAERHARNIDGVKYVQNEIRPRVGGSI